MLDHSKSEFLRLISHEFRTPLHGILGVGELMLEGILAIEEKNQLEGIFKRSRRRILSILDDALLLTEIDVNVDRFRFLPVSLSAALNCAIERTAEFAESRAVTLVGPAADLSLVLADENLLVRALQALLETAVKFSGKGEAVRSAYGCGQNSRTLIIESRGRTIPGPALAKLFDLFSIGDAITPGGDLGVGLPLAYRILSLFGAAVSVGNQDPSGIKVTVSLKSAAPDPRPITLP
jgi:signal transduction histidine kinase